MSSKLKKFVFIFVFVFVASVTMVVGHWYQYVTAASQPYDEVGIELNQMMPGFMNKWGCDQLKARFARQLPPYGCQAQSGDVRQWR